VADGKNNEKKEKTRPIQNNDFLFRWLMFSFSASSRSIPPPFCKRLDPEPRGPRLRAEAFACMGAFGEDMHFGVQAQVP
jgi:hypothetical protein